MTLISIPQNALRLKTEFGFHPSQRKAIDDMCEHIACVGLLNPLIVTPEKGRYIILDGKIRFQAIQKLARQKRLPRSLNKVPCLLNDKEPMSIHMNGKPLLLSEQDLAHAILCADRKGATYPEISALLDCSEKVITQARSIGRLHAKLKLAFINTTITLAQAAALSTIPNPQAQWDLMIQLGPFASEPKIIAAIAKGETVLGLPNGDMLILPSRAYKPKLVLVPASRPHPVLKLAA